VAQAAFEGLEPCEGKLSRTVLRGRGSSNTAELPDLGQSRPIPNNFCFELQETMDKDQEKSLSWWQTLPGILTAVGGVIVAMTGLIGALYQAGLIGGQGHDLITTGLDKVVPSTQKVPSSSPAPQPKPSVLPLPITPSEPPSNVASLKPMSESFAVITTTAGEQVSVKANSLYLGPDNDAKGLPLSNGQTVNFDKIKSIELLGVERTDDFKNYEESAGLPKVRITLWNGKTITGIVMIPFAPFGMPHFFLNGSGELGDFRLRPWKVKNVQFER
jgi:hypothetical protein